MRVAKADLVPTDHNLREQYPDWQALERACQEFMADVNTRPHRATRKAPVFLLEQEREHMHRLPRLPHTLCFGQTRKVDRQATVSVGEAIYSVPHTLIGEQVWVRADAEQLVVVHVNDAQGPREVARHLLTTPGRRASTISITRRGRRVRWSASPAPATARSGRSFRSARVLSGGSSAPPRREPRGSGARWPRPSTWPSSTAQGR